MPVSSSVGWPMTEDLKDLKILITRPPQHAQELLAKITALDGIATCVPLFAVEPTIDAEYLSRILSSVQHMNLGIFVSRNAAELLLPHLQKFSAMQWATLGPSTAAYLRQNGLTKLILPPTPPYDSAALVACLKSQRMPLQDQSIILFSGEDGLGWLASELQRQGAQVKTMSVYRRVRTKIDSDLNYDIIVISCVTSLIYLKELAYSLGAAIAELQLLVVSDRICNAALEMGFLKVYTAESMSEADILSALLYLRKHHR